MIKVHENPIISLVFSLFFFQPLYASAKGESAVARHKEYLSAGNYLAAYNSDDEIENSQLRALFESIDLSFLNREQDAQRVFEKRKIAEETENKDEIVDVESLERSEAIAEIVAVAKNRRVVMLNEAHHISRHRLFAKDLALALRRVGYNCLAVEALFKQGLDALNKFGFPTVSGNGFYTNDPEFAYFIRAAMRSGYALSAYEPLKYKSQAERERKQAENIKKILDDDPSAKVFVYAGFAHIRETFDSDTPKMAALLKNEANIDPLTIDQVGGTPHLDRSLDDSSYHQVESLIGDAPSIFRNKSGEWLVSGRYDGAVDMTVYHPRAKFIGGRPGWLVRDEGREAVLVRKPDKELHEWVNIKAVVANEENSVPIDQYLIAPHKAVATLYLPEGEYQLIAEFQNGQQRFMRQIEIR
ncbi:hypothetical protein [Microbulbifer hainanensis]|uniref:hypothetical protein n=1 Tax=Microbulbifer hainanensis TaxID=2735675 RepID=UPI0018688BD6|nr:hypothetical protein [Microbulbifer hainanensis]